MTDAWKVTAGDPAVTVGVADTGLDYTHSELAPKVVHVEDFTQTEPAHLQDVLLPVDVGRRLGRTYGGPANTDWNGHGSGSAATSPARSTGSASTASPRRSASSR